LNCCDDCCTLTCYTLNQDGVLGREKGKERERDEDGYINGFDL